MGARSHPKDESKVVNSVSNTLLQAMLEKERQLDAEIEQLDNMVKCEDELEVLRARRKQELLRKQKERCGWLQLGHGEISESTGEMDFFNACKNSPKVVGIFYKPDCNIDRSAYLERQCVIIAKELIDIRFIKMNVEKHPFIIARLRISVIPSTVFILEQVQIHTMIGFEDVGRKDDFSKDDFMSLLRRLKMDKPFSPQWRDTRKEIIDEERDD